MYFGYTLFILISLITYNFIPVGAIVGTVAFFAMSLPIIFAVGISIFNIFNAFCHGNIII